MPKPKQMLHERRGRPAVERHRINISLSKGNHDALVLQAEEAGRTVAAQAAYIIERYQLQDPQVIANDVIAERLNGMLNAHFERFLHQFGRVMIRDLHETVRLRRLLNYQLRSRLDEQTVKQVNDEAWQATVRELDQLVNGIAGGR